MNVRSYHYTIADSWLYSAICHLAILLVLLSVTAPIVHRRPPRQLIVTMGEHSGEELSVLHARAPSLPPADQAIDLAAAIDLRPPPVASPAAVAIPPRSLAAVGSVSGDSDGRSGRGRGATFFGTAAAGDRFVYIIDASRSMRHGGRLRMASFELQNSINQLTANQSFCVLLFSDTTKMMFYEPTAELINATELNKSRLSEWLRRVKPRGGTNPRGALRISLELEPDAIFILSDGAFEPAEEATDDTLQLEIPQLIRRFNTGRVQIHSIAFADPSSKANMAEIAALTGGRFRFIAKDELRTTVFYAEEIAAKYLADAESLADRGQSELPNATTLGF
jgi:hypothetical protein